MAKIIVYAVIFCLTWSGSSLAGDCRKVQTYLTEARDSIVTGFKKYDIEIVEKGVEDLIFWDSYIQIECRRGMVAQTPIQWLAARTDGISLTPYIAGFLFWIDDVKFYFDIDISPSGLVRGRTFK